MPSTSTAKHPALPWSITFTDSETEHSYIDQEGRDYISVTTLVHRFFPEFNAKEAAGRISKRESRVVEDILAEWKLGCDIACAYGTKVHNYAENLKEGRKLPVASNPKEAIAFKSVENALRGIEKHYEILGTECIVFDPLYRVSGTIDLPCRHRETGRMAILDYKTNKSIHLVPRYGQYGHKPIAHIGDCNGNHYRLQFATYAQIMRDSGYVPEDTGFDNAAIYIAPGSEQPVWIPFSDAQKEATDMINAWFKQFDTVENQKYKVSVAEFMARGERFKGAA